MQTAYKQADARKLDGRRMVVDVERGRTTRHWYPRRLGGGIGYYHGDMFLNKRRKGKML